MTVSRCIIINKKKFIKHRENPLDVNMPIDSGEWSYGRFSFLISSLFQVLLKVWDYEQGDIAIGGAGTQKVHILWGNYNWDVIKDIHNINFKNYFSKID